MDLVGRSAEITLFSGLLRRGTPALVALYGRRRVGKTFLIRQILSDSTTYLEITGRKDGTLTQQLASFRERLEQVAGERALPGRLENWHQALRSLTAWLREHQGPHVVFFDELPWLATRRSGLLSEIDHFWNTEWSRLPGVIVVLCGSAAQWMLSKVINAKGGLYNRVTHTIHLQPFDLATARAYLQSRSVNMSRTQVAEAYMAFGGVPQYLSTIQPGRSVPQAVQDAFFASGAPLAQEFERIFPALFANPALHRAIISRLAAKRYGVPRAELLVSLRDVSSGSLTNALAELEAAGFIKKFVPYGLRRRAPFFRLYDELTLFHSKWVANALRQAAAVQQDHWVLTSQTPAWSAWAGYAFENLCLRHVDALLIALGISGVRCLVSSWRFGGDHSRGLPGAQVDLVIDRADRIINLVEFKFTREPFVVDKTCLADLRRKAAVFKAVVSPTKAIVPVLFSAQGVVENSYSAEVAGSDMTLDDLFLRARKG